jgi:hypothetical protein
MESQSGVSRLSISTTSTYTIDGSDSPHSSELPTPEMRSPESRILVYPNHDYRGRTRPVLRRHDAQYGCRNLTDSNSNTQRSPFSVSALQRDRLPAEDELEDELYDSEEVPVKPAAPALTPSCETPSPQTDRLHDVLERWINGIPCLPSVPKIENGVFYNRQNKQSDLRKTIEDNCGDH